MRLGVLISHVGLADTEFVETLCRTLEDLGFGGVWLTDHIVRPTDYDSPYPYSNNEKMRGDIVAEPLTTLAFMAAHTVDVELGTAVLIVPQRNPILVAKQVATLDRLSRGRVRLGVGVGWLREEFELLGASFTGRGRRTDDYIELMQKLWTTEFPIHVGADFQLDGRIDLQPKPHRPSGVPVVIGGHSPAAVRRAARLGRGFYPFGTTAGQLDTLVADLRREVEACGRGPDSVDLILPWMPEKGWVEHARDLGASQLVMNVAPGWSVDEIVDRMGRFAERATR